MATIDRNTGKWITGLDDVWQSVATILGTQLRALVEARDFGSEMPRLVDRALNPLTKIEFYAAVPGAINRVNPETLMAEEPRFRLKRVTLSTDSDPENGNPVFDIEGIYYPRGQFGDFSVGYDAKGKITVE